MRKLLGISILALALSGCASTGGGGGSVDSAGLTARAKQIQDYTRLACKFVPTIGTIANILSSGAVTSVVAIASDICNAVTTAPLADGGRRAAKVNGVAIKGKFVK